MAILKLIEPNNTLLTIPISVVSEDADRKKIKEDYPNIRITNVKKIKTLTKYLKNTSEKNK